MRRRKRDRLRPASKIAEFINDLVSAATIGSLGVWRHSAVRCRKRPQHKPCPGRMMVCEMVNGHIEYRCPICGSAGTITGWQGSLSDLSELRDCSEPPFFEVVLTNSQYDQLKQFVTMDLEWDDIIYSASALDGGIVLRADGPEMRAFANYLSSKLNEPRVAKRGILIQIVDGIQTVLGGWNSS